MNRHPFHSLCPYFAMFPEEFVEEQLLKHTSKGDLVFDPFCGRGTTIFQSLLMGREAAGSDVNSVAACVAGAKADAPTLQEIVRRLDQLEVLCGQDATPTCAPTPFFEACYHESTLRQILFLRSALDWRTDRIDRFIAAMTLGALHGESHRSGFYLSNRMPRTISTKPDYSVRWWAKRNLQPPARDAFDVLRRMASFRYRMPPAERSGRVLQSDARSASKAFPEFLGSVRLVVTSPPYLDTTDFAEDQWLRLWFLGGAERPVLRQNKDDRITNVSLYWNFLEESWRGVRDLLDDSSVVVIRIGGARLSKDDLFAGVRTTLASALDGFQVTAMSQGVTSCIKPRETSTFTKGSSTARVEHDFSFAVDRVGRTVN